MKSSGRWLERWGVLLALALVLTSQIALAQRVAVIPLAGDKKGRVRAQAEAALGKAGEVKVVSSKAYAATAKKKKGLRGAAISSPRSVPVMASELRLDGVLTGSVGKRLQVRLLGPDGRELWSGAYVLKAGRLPAREVRRLASDVAEAVRAAKRPVPQPVAPVSPAPPPASEASEVRFASGTPPAPEPPPASPSQQEVGLQEVSPTPTPEWPVASSGRSDEAVSEVRGPPRVRVFLGAAVPWRQYCARPGVASCGEFDARAPELRQGDTVDFRSELPYAGGAAELEFFPLAREQSLLRGLGLTASYQQGFARTTVQVRSSTGQTSQREVFATDKVYGAMLAYRLFFGFGLGEQPLWGHGGLRLGMLGRAFEVADGVESPLPVTRRLSPAVALDFSVPVWRAVRIVGAGQLLLLPRPGEALSPEVRDHGQSVTSFGWGAELGVAGEVWGPLGYSARFRVDSFRDGFSGQGALRGWGSGGVAEELYATVLAGVTASW